MKTIKEMLKAESTNYIINEMSISLKNYKQKVDGLRFQLVENWCLCKWCQIFNQENINFNHWIIELKACINHLKLINIKNGIDKKRTLIRMLVNDYDYNQTDMIIRIIKDKFDLENINNSCQIETVASEFANEINNIITVISDDSVSTNLYIQKTFKI